MLVRIPLLGYQQRSCLPIRPSIRSPSVHSNTTLGKIVKGLPCWGTRWYVYWTIVCFYKLLSKAWSCLPIFEIVNKKNKKRVGDSAYYFVYFTVFFESFVKWERGQEKYTLNCGWRGSKHTHTTWWEIYHHQRRESMYDAMRFCWKSCLACYTMNSTLTWLLAPATSIM